MKNIKSQLILFVFLISQSILVQAQFNKEITTKVDAYLKTQSEEFHGTILLAVGDKILMNKGYGVADYSHNIANSADTKYLIGSTTKHFTVILILQLMEKGLINLDDTIDKYFPNGPVDKTSKTTIRNLLLHQSGIPQCYSGFSDYLEKYSRIYHDQEEYLQLIWDSKLRHETGQGVTYSSPGYYLLGVILEKVTKKSYPELLKENILSPLNMENTFVDNNLTIHSNMATGYQRGVTGIVKSRVNEQSNHFAAGDLISTTYDLFLFQRCLNYDSDSVLPSDLKKMLLDRQSKNNTFDGVFFGSKYTQYFNNNRDSLVLIGVGTSGSFGYRARMTRFVNEDACYIVLSNIETDNTMNNDLFSFLSDILLEKLNIDYKFSRKEPIHSENHNIPYKSALQGNKYFGIYKKDKNSFISITTSNDTLIFQSAFLNWGSYNFEKKYLVARNKYIFKDLNSNNEFYFSTDKTTNMIMVNNNDTIFKASKINTDTNYNSEYAGLYYSLEHQKTYKLKVNNEILVSYNFFGKSNTKFEYLKKDMFSCKYGFIMFNRNENDKIKGFRLNGEGIDTYEGVKVGLFEKK